MKTLKDLFLNELADIYDAERRIVKAFPKLAKAATCEQLKELLQSHVEECEGQVNKLSQVFEAFDAKVKAKTCEATVGLLAEASSVAADFKGSPAINAAIISAVQKVKHYEIASYGCLHEWAGVLGSKIAASLLKDILNEEKATNDALIKLARDKSNEEALGQEEESSPAPAAAKRIGSVGRGVLPAVTGRSRMTSPRK